MRYPRKLEIPRDHPLRNFLLRVTTSSFETAGIPDRELIRYVTDVLVDFAHVDHAYRFLNDPGRRRTLRIRDWIGELEDSSRRGLWPEPEVRKHIGDSCLFFTGVYPEHLQRETLFCDLGSFVRLGTESYRRVSEYEALGPSAALYRKLSAVFDRCVGALHIEREFLYDPFYQYLVRQLNW